MDFPRHLHNQLKIAISGAAQTDTCGDTALDITRELGRQVALQGAVLLTGATSGVPLWASRGAKEAGGTVVGISPAKDEQEHVKQYKLPLDYTDLILYTGQGYPGRDILLTQSADAILIGCGRIGTFHEFTIAFEDKKPIGILKGDYTSDDLMEDIIRQSGRAKDDPYVITSADPKELVEKVIALTKTLKEKD